MTRGIAAPAFAGCAFVEEWCATLGGGTAAVKRVASSALGSVNSQRRPWVSVCAGMELPASRFTSGFLRVWRRRLGLERFVDLVLLLLGRFPRGRYQKNLAWSRPATESHQRCIELTHSDRLPSPPRLSAIAWSLGCPVLHTPAV